MKRNIKGDLVYYTFDSLTKTGIVNHCFTTKHGGVSSGSFATLNLAFKKEDKYENVYKNFDIISEAINTCKENMIMCNQTHGVNVLVANEKHKGSGFPENNKIPDTDGLVTNHIGLALVTSHADCVPIFFVDTENKAIGLAHSGWRGTLNRISENIVKEMENNYGTNPQSLKVGIGPSIGRCCFEVDIDVALLFKEMLSVKFNISTDILNKLIEKGANNKYYIDLWEINKVILINLGILEENIEIAKICTKCNMNDFYSHRGTKGLRGSMCAIIELIR